MRDHRRPRPPSPTQRTTRAVDIQWRSGLAADRSIIRAFADGFADKPGATFGTMNAVLAEKLPGYVRPNFYAIIPRLQSTGPDSAATAPPNANDRA